MPQGLLEQSLSNDARAGAGRSALSGFGLRATGIISVPLAVALAFLAAENAFELGGSLAVLLAALAVVALESMLLIGLRDLRRAEVRTDAALFRAHVAEGVERSRADQLARVLEASQGLRLAGDGRVDYMGVLATITPPGATCFLVRRDREDTVVEAAHGPLAPLVVGVRRLDMPDAEGADPPQLTTYSAHGRRLGAAVPPEDLAMLGVPIESSLAVPLIAQDGRTMGVLHMVDPGRERVVEPSFVALAQLVANQIAVAMQNDELLASARRQLAEVQRVQHQLVQASKLGAIGELAAAVAHEVNNPLTGILGFSELLLAELPPEDRRRGEVTIIRDEAIRARTIVRALLDFARPRTPQRVQTDLNALARSAVELVRYRAQEAHVQIHEEYGDLPNLDLDPESFRQVLLNLCTNGIDAMPDGGDLSVSTVLRGDKVGIVVGDTGVGMDRQTRGRAFAPFFSARARGGYGTGLGLSVSLNIVEGHGGIIDVQSEPGSGAVFTVWLPVTSSSIRRTPDTESPSDNRPSAASAEKTGGVEVAA
jgi:signal transduction histidine kinase